MSGIEHLAWYYAGRYLPKIERQLSPSKLAVRPPRAEVSWAAAPAAWWVGLILRYTASPLEKVPKASKTT